LLKICNIYLRYGVICNRMFERVHKRLLMNRIKDAFRTRFSPKRVILVGKSGIPVDTLLKTNPQDLF